MTHREQRMSHETSPGLLEWSVLYNAHSPPQYQALTETSGNLTQISGFNIDSEPCLEGEETCTFQIVIVSTELFDLSFG